MKISSSSIQTYARTGLRESDTQRAAAQTPEHVQRPQSPQARAPVETTTETSPANRQIVEHVPVVAVTNSQPSQHLHRIYPVSSGEHLSPSRQTAMQAYTTTQQMSREAQGSGEFLGSIDLFV